MYLTSKSVCRLTYRSFHLSSDKKSNGLYSIFSHKSCLIFFDFNKNASSVLEFLEGSIKESEMKKRLQTLLKMKKKSTIPCSLWFDPSLSGNYTYSPSASYLLFTKEIIRIQHSFCMCKLAYTATNVFAFERGHP